jgi:pimeloyl-ACP methyl ester carboxylesterase
VRARQPEHSGYAVRSGVRLYYEVFGDSPTTVVLFPPWAIVHSRTWKLQVPYLARHFRVITFDARGNGHSDRPQDALAYTDDELVADAIAVLDATDTETAIMVGLSLGARILLRLAVAHPQRVTGAVFVAPAVRLGEVLGARFDQPFEPVRDTDEGWAKYNAHYWRRDFSGFAEFFFGEVFVEAHSTKAVDDAVGWALETDPETLIATERARDAGDPADFGPSVFAALAAQVRCPSLVVHGDRDRIVGPATGPALAEALGCPLVLFQDAGHCPHARHPVRFNLLLRQFVEGVTHARS